MSTNIVFPLWHTGTRYCLAELLPGFANPTTNASATSAITPRRDNTATRGFLNRAQRLNILIPSPFYLSSEFMRLGAGSKGSLLSQSCYGRQSDGECRSP